MRQNFFLLLLFFGSAAATIAITSLPMLLISPNAITADRDSISMTIYP